MAVTEVKEQYKGIKGQLSNGVQTSIKLFSVVFDSADDISSREILCYTAAANGVAIPQYGDPHPAKDNMYVNKVDVSPGTGPLEWRVTVSYSTPSSSSSGNPEDPPNPLSQSPSVRFSFASREEMIDQDVNGDPILNSAGQTPDPPITKEFSDLVLTFERNVSSYNPATAASYKDAVNSDSFLGLSAGKAKVNDYSADIQYDSTYGTYWRERKEIIMRLDERAGEQVGWKKRILDQGVMVKIQNKTDETDQKYIAPSADVDEGYEIIDKEIMLLDGSGAVLADGGSAVWKTLVLCSTKVFSSGENTVEPSI